MKKLIFVLFVLPLVVFSQNNFVEMSSNYFFSFDEKKSIPINYIVGYETFGYPYAIKTLPIGYVGKDERYPILKYYKVIKNEFIGGVLTDQLNGDSLIIQNIEFKVVEDIVKKEEIGMFQVFGKNYKKEECMYFLRTSTGRILEENENYVLFWENNEFIFKIEKNEKYKFKG
jgi:hypothetical protein